MVGNQDELSTEFGNSIALQQEAGWWSLDQPQGFRENVLVYVTNGIDAVAVNLTRRRLAFARDS